VSVERAAYASLGHALRAFVSAPDAETAINEALAAAGLAQLPSDPASLSSFVLGPVRQAMVVARGVSAFDHEAPRIAHDLVKLARALSSADRPGPRVALVLTKDPEVESKVRANTDDGVHLRIAYRLLDLSPLSALRRNAPTALIVDVDTSPVGLTTLARVTHAFGPQCRVVLAGVSERALAQLARLYPAIERWERKGSIEEAAASV
jgi:hypothetical protein